MPRYQDGVTEATMRDFMASMRGSTSWDEFESKVSAFDDRSLKAHLRSVVSFLALNKGQKLPGWLHDSKNDAVRGIFEDITSELKSNASLAGLLSNESECFYLRLSIES